jgi:glucose-1-phosphate cytidylyltransferase
MMHAVILCGGQGTRLREETEFKPKPMVAIGGRPILWHILSHYRAYGIRDFVLCLGYRGDVIRDYFLNFRHHNCDIRVDLGDGTVTVLAEERVDWRVTLVDTGGDAMTGARIRRACKHVHGDRFLATYGDGVSDVDLRALISFHSSEGKKATVTAVRPPSRFGELLVDGGLVRSFTEKPQTGAGWINGGYFVFETASISELSDDEDLSLETQVLEELAARGELAVFKHAGFWQCMDTYREMQLLNHMWESGSAPWKVW